MKVQHSQIYIDPVKVKVSLPLVEEMREIQKSGEFVLLEDPVEKRETLIMGMFVLRASHQSWDSPLREGEVPKSIYDVQDWIYNIKTINGGSPQAAGNVMDGFRLGFQYAISDAVMVGSTTVLNGGMPSAEGHPGYLWQPYNCAQWPHMQEADPRMLERFSAQRKKLQELGYASDRRYPAQIVVTRSGKETKPDLLEASIFHEYHPDGEAVEAYIVTGSAGSKAIRERAARYGMAERIDSLLIELPAAGDPAGIDLQSLPGILYRDYDIRIANHDGGALVLEAFCKAGIIPQFNFTFARKPSLYEAISAAQDIGEEDKARVLKNFDELVQNFFRTPDGSIPKSFSIAQLLIDEPDEAAVVVLDTREVKDFG